MMPTQETLTNSQNPPEQKQSDDKKSMFMLYYRQGQNPHSQFTFFFASGSFNQIVAAAKNFCETVNYRFVTVKPAIINFEEEIKKLNRVGEY